MALQPGTLASSLTVTVTAWPGGDALRTKTRGRLHGSQGSLAWQEGGEGVALCAGPSRAFHP